MITVQNTLKQWPVKRIVEVLGEVSTRWLDVSYPLRKQAVARLSVTTGYSAGMIDVCLRDAFEELRRERLWELLEAELGDPLLLDRFRPYGKAGRRRTFARGPRLTTHLWSGAVFVAGLPPLVCALLAKSPSVIKPSSEETEFAVFWHRSLEEVDKGLATCVSVLPWKGGDEAFEKPLFERSECVVAFGSDATIEAIRAKLKPSTRFIAYGHKVSAAVIGKEALTLKSWRTVLETLRRDLWLFAGAGCLSPRMVLIEEGGRVSPKRFEDSFRQALVRTPSLTPSATLLSESASRFRSAVAAEKKAPPVSFHSFGSFEEIERTLVPLQPHLSSIGVALSPSRRDALAERLALLGASRIVPLGTLQKPSLLWHHDGRSLLNDFLYWTDLEL